jgi:uncharacterized membrane protein (UPF0127 family)
MLFLGRRTFLFLLIVILAGCQQNNSKQNKICWDTKCIDVEVVYKPEDMMRGLMFRESIPENFGMLFAFSDNGRHSFWMKDTLIPLDILWLDNSRRVIHIEKNLPPCQSDPCPTYSSDKDAMYVLEINANKAEAWKIVEGKELDFRLKALNDL